MEYPLRAKTPPGHCEHLRITEDSVCALVVLTARGRGQHTVGKAWHMAGEASCLAGCEGQLR